MHMHGISFSVSCCTCHVYVLQAARVAAEKSKNKEVQYSIQNTVVL